MSDSFEMQNLTGAAQAQLAELLTKAEQQLNAVENQKTAKLTKDEQTLRLSFLSSAKPLIASLKKNLKSKNYNAMASSIETWQDNSSDDLAKLEKLVKRSLGLSPVASLVAFVDSIKEAVS